MDDPDADPFSIPPPAPEDYGYASPPEDCGGYAAPPEAFIGDVMQHEDGGDIGGGGMGMMGAALVLEPPQASAVDADMSMGAFMVMPDDQPADRNGGMMQLDGAAGAVTESNADDDDPSGDAEDEEGEAGPSAMQLWNEEWQRTLKERKDSENALKGEAVEAARAEMEDFQSRRDVKCESRMARNRADEQEKLEAIEADLENDNSWQRVVKLVELQHDTVEGAADVGRMRDVMILLKNEPSRATVLTN